MCPCKDEKKGDVITSGEVIVTSLWKKSRKIIRYHPK